MNKGILVTFLTFAGGLALWEGLVRALNVPSYVFPPPSEIVRALVRGLDTPISDPGGYYFHFGVTLFEALFGLSIGILTGVTLGTLISQVELFERTILPWIIAFMSIPKIALAPLFVVWFGLGLVSKVVMVVVITFFPLLINTIAGLRASDPEQIELMRSYAASRWQIFKTVQVPNALPYFFAGLDLAVVLSVLGAVVGEFVGGQYGLGVLVMQMNMDLDMRGVFSVLILLAALGLGLHFIVRVIQRRVLFWAPAERSVTAL